MSTVHSNRSVLNSFVQLCDTVAFQARSQFPCVSCEMVFKVRWDSGSLSGNRNQGEYGSEAFVKEVCHESSSVPGKVRTWRSASLELSKVSMSSQQLWRSIHMRWRTTGFKSFFCFSAKHIFMLLCSLVRCSCSLCLTTVKERLIYRMKWARQQRLRQEPIRMQYLWWAEK